MGAPAERGRGYFMSFISWLACPSVGARPQRLAKCCPRRIHEEPSAQRAIEKLDVSDIDLDTVDDEQSWAEFMQTQIPQDGTRLPTYEEYRQRMMEERERRAPKPYYKDDIETEDEAIAAREAVEELRASLADGPDPNIFRVYAPDEDPRSEISRLERSRDQARQVRASIMEQVLKKLSFNESSSEELLIDGDSRGPRRSFLLLAITRVVADRHLWDSLVANPSQIQGGDPRHKLLETCIGLIMGRQTLKQQDSAVDQAPIEIDNTSGDTQTDATGQSGQGFEDNQVMGVEDALAANLLFAAIELIDRDFAYLQSNDKAAAALESLRHPWNWRAMLGPPKRERRRVVLHVGPTNSGKTYNCLEKLSGSRSGLYIAPARLLAWEVRDRLDFDFATKCSLYAVHDVRVTRGAQHEAWAVDAWILDPLQPRREVDVAVIDEAHELDVGDNGWMIAQAIMSAPCRELHICMDPMAHKAIERMLMEAGDEVDLVQYKRMAPLSLPEKPFKGRVEELQKGDCVVTTSIGDVYRLKGRIERNSDFKVSILHEDMSNRVRREDVDKFNRGKNSVLVATQVVGLGLNLNITRVMFWEIQKIDGISRRPFSHLELRQIAGRAGRYISEFSQGMVCVRDRKFLKPVRGALGQAPDPVSRIGVLPSSQAIEEFMRLAYPDSSAEYDEVLDHLAQLVEAEYGSRYGLTDLMDIKQRLRLLEDVPMAFEDRWLFCLAPIDVLDPIMTKTVLVYATRFSRGKEPIPCGFDDQILRNPESLQDLEDLTSVVETLRVYHWLSICFPDRYTEFRFAGALEEDGRRLLQEST